MLKGILPKGGVIYDLGIRNPFTEIMEKEGYTALNVSDGFSGNGQDPGWKNSGLPTK